MDKLDMKSMNVTEENVKKIQQAFPNCVTEVIENSKVKLAVDFDALREELTGNIIADKQERYQFTWPDKAKAKQTAVSPISATLRPCKEESVDFDTTKNLYIEGDNLDVLKLLQETYLGKVKMIYIDPPYNTGNDFVYNDDFAQETDEYMENSGQYDEQGNRLFQNTESNGRFHTDWLNMIYPRLRLAKDLLSDDGVIFISIDDNEVENLLKISDEIFGRNNRVGAIIVKSNPRGSMSTAELANLHEYLLVYCKSIFNAEILGLELTDEMQSEYKYSDSKGAYRLLGLRMRGGFWRRSERPKLFFPIYVNPNDGSISLEKSETFTETAMPIQPSTLEDGTWRWSKEKILQNSSELIAKKVKRSDSFIWDVFQKDYQERQGGRKTKVKSIWDESEINYQNGAIEIKNLFEKSGIFDYSKPKYLIKKSIKMVENGDCDIILDFFSGSATTAHAVMQLNAEDGGNRKFIMVQLPELCDEKSEAYKAGYKNICEIGKERIRRAGKKIKDEAGEKAQNLDIGFRVLKLDSSNMQPVFYNPHAITQSLLDSTIDNIKPDRTPMDLLFQVMLDLGVMLSAKIEEKQINGKKYYVVNGNDLIACFDDDIDNTVITEIAKLHPLYAVFKDKSFATDSVGINNEQLFKTYSPTTIVKVI